MDIELLGKVVQREERMERVETLLVFCVDSFNLSVVAGRIRADQLVKNDQLSSCFLKKRG